MSHTILYNIRATTTGEAVGILPVHESLNKRKGDAPVILNARIRDWNASRNINEGGPVRLSISMFPSTFQSNGEVWVSEDPEDSHDWYIVPRDKNTRDGQFYIAANPESIGVWTATRAGEPIRIEDIKFPADRSQIFQFSRNGQLAC